MSRLDIVPDAPLQVQRNALLLRYQRQQLLRFSQGLKFVYKAKPKLATCSRDIALALVMHEALSY